MRKQELARQTRAARRDPVLAALLDDALARLGLLDPERHIRDAIACYPRDAIVDAIGIYSGKRTAGTLPEGVDARYLLGIVRNVHHRHEAEPITEALIRERLSARDRFLAPLVAERDAVLSAGNGDVGAALVALVDRLVRAARTIDRHVWLDAAADLVAPHPPDVRIDLAKRAARRIHTTFALSARDRAHSSAPSCAASGRSRSAIAARHASVVLSSSRPSRGQHIARSACLTPHPTVGRPPFRTGR